MFGRLCARINPSSKDDESPGVNDHKCETGERSLYLAMQYLSEEDETFRLKEDIERVDQGLCMQPNNFIDSFCRHLFRETSQSLPDRPQWLKETIE